MAIGPVGYHQQQTTPDDISRLTAVYRVSARGWVDPRCPPVPAGVTPLAYGPDGPNLVLVESATTAGMSATIEWVMATGVPATVLVAGPALGGAQVFADAGWVCIGVQPLMRRIARRGRSRRLAACDVREVRDERDLAELNRLLTEVFTVGAGVPAPVDGVITRTWALYGDTGMLSCAMTGQVGDVVTVWGVATWPHLRRQGFAYRLMSALHNKFEDAGVANEFLLLSTEAGVPLYEALDYRAASWWQAWSRPRWFLGRA